MSYTTIQAAVRGYIQGLAAFDDRDVVIGDLRVLDRGHDPYVIMSAGNFTHVDDVSWGGRITGWTIYLELFVRHYGDGTEQTALTTHRQSIIDEMDKRFVLGGLAGVVSALVSEGDEPTAWVEQDGGEPAFLAQRLSFVVVEKTSTTGGDYA